MNIKILGTGCPSCQRLEENVRQAAKELGIDDAIFEKVTNIADIVSYGIMSAPALVIDEEVKLAGKVASVDEAKTILSSLSA